MGQNEAYDAKICDNSLPYKTYLLGSKCGDFPKISPYFQKSDRQNFGRRNLQPHKYVLQGMRFKTLMRGIFHK